MAGKKKQAQLTPEEKLQQALVPEDEQPYKVPANWCWTRLGNVTNIIMGQSPNGGSITENEKDTPLIGGAADMGEKYPEIKRYTNKPTKISSDEDLIICVRATLGKPIFSDGRYCLGRGVAAIRPLVGSRKLYKYFFLNFEQYLFDNATGTTFAQVNSNILQKMPLALPPLAEQQRIVERIESLFAKLDEAKENMQNVLDGFETRKAAILHKAFTGELTANWRKQHDVSIDSWEEKKLGKIVKNIKDKYEPTLNNKKCVKYIGLEHIEKNNGIIGFGSSDDVKSLKTIFELGDILYGKLRPYLNKHDIAKFSGICSTDILVYRAEDFNTAKFINYFMNTEKFIFYTVSNSKGINLPRISEKEVSGILVNVPTLSEQSEIVRIIDDLLAKEQQAKELAENALAKIDLIKKAILARAFRGELGTNNPADESAVELLKRVL